MLDEAFFTTCPYCGEPAETVLEAGEPCGRQVYIEDCAVCCRPMVITVRLDAAGVPEDIQVRAEHE